MNIINKKIYINLCVVHDEYKYKNKYENLLFFIYTN